jgi:hypothetical protein
MWCNLMQQEEEYKAFCHQQKQNMARIWHASILYIRSLFTIFKQLTVLNITQQ